jgi:hypothetical protein
LCFNYIASLHIFGGFLLILRDEDALLTNQRRDNSGKFSVGILQN